MTQLATTIKIEACELRCGMCCEKSIWNICMEIQCNVSLTFVDSIRWMRVLFWKQCEWNIKWQTKDASSMDVFGGHLRLCDRMSEWVNQNYGTNNISGIHLAYARDAGKCICLFQYRKIAAAARSTPQLEHQIIYYSGSIVDLIFFRKRLAAMNLNSEQWTMNTHNQSTQLMFKRCLSEYEQ